MAVLRYSPTIKRLIRQDSPEELGRPTRLYLEEAVREGSVFTVILPTAPADNPTVV